MTLVLNLAPPFSAGFTPPLTIGAPKGAGLHSIKRLYGDNKADEIVASFQKRRIALTWENLASTMRQALDHKSDYAWECYVRAVKRLQGTSVEARLQEALVEQEAETAMLETKLIQVEVMAARAEARLLMQLDAAKREAHYWRAVAKRRMEH